MVSTEERRAALARTRKKLAYFKRAKPHWLTAIKDTGIAIDALESLIVLDMPKGAKHEKKEEG